MIPAGGRRHAPATPTTSTSPHLGDDLCSSPATPEPNPRHAGHIRAGECGSESGRDGGDGGGGRWYSQLLLHSVGSCRVQLCVISRVILRDIA